MSRNSKLLETTSGCLKPPTCRLKKAYAAEHRSAMLYAAPNLLVLATMVSAELRQAHIRR
eukprot:11275905-Alexandrium_andersonii.AAC.1